MIMITRDLRILFFFFSYFLSSLLLIFSFPFYLLFFYHIRHLRITKRHTIINQAVVGYLLKIAKSRRFRFVVARYREIYWSIRSFKMRGYCGGLVAIKTNFVVGSKVFERLYLIVMIQLGAMLLLKSEGFTICMYIHM